MASALFTDTRFRLDYNVTLVKQEIANNRSLIRRRAVIVKTGSSYAWSGNVSSWSSTGPTSRSGTFTYNFGNYSQLVLLDVEEWVTHTANGTRSFTAAFSVTADSPLGNASLSFSVTLKAIPRSTTPNIAGGGGFTTGVESVINLPRYVSTYTHDVSWSLGSKSGSIAVGAETSTTWTPDDDVMTELPNAASGNVTITVVTKSGATTIGTTNTQFGLTAGAAVVPSVSGVAWDDDNPTIKTNIGAFVQGLSLINGSVVAAGIHGSTIEVRRLIVGGQQFPQGTTFQAASAGTVVASGEAVDSRGRTGSKAANFTVLAYEPPKLGANGWQVNRANASNVVDDDGTYLRLDLHAIAASLIVGTQKNALNIQVRTRPLNGAWTNRNTINPGLIQNGAIQVSGGGVFLVSQSYEVEVTITDNTGVAPLVLRTIIGTTVVTLDLRDNRVGVGKMHEQGALDVGPGGIYSDGVLVPTVDDLALYATEGVAGLVRRATQAEVNAGVDNVEYVTPATLADRASRVGEFTIVRGVMNTNHVQSVTRDGDLVTVTIRVDNGNGLTLSASFQVIVVLPVWARPAKDITIPAARADAASSALVKIAANGEVSAASTNSVTFATTFPAA